MTGFITTRFDLASPDMYDTEVFRARLVETTETRLSRDTYTITSLILRRELDGDYRRYTVNLDVGICLYNYLHSDDRYGHASRIDFEITATHQTQHITAFEAFDGVEIAALFGHQNRSTTNSGDRELNSTNRLGEYA